jgi:hypothetical protein
MTDYRTRWFALLEFNLLADTPNKMFAQDDREHYSVIGHDSPTCKGIKSKRTARAISLGDYLAEHEFFDGELVFGDPWPCAICIPEVPEFKPLAEPAPEPFRKVPTQPTAKSNLKPYRTAPQSGKINPTNPNATEGQVRKLMALYRASKPQASREALMAAETRAKAMTKRDASAKIDELSKAAGTATQTAPASNSPAKQNDRFTPPPTIPPGYYAVPSRTGHNDLDFWRVDEPVVGGQWDGFVPVVRVVGGHSDIKVRGKERFSALEAIAKHGIEESGMLYARELKRCRRCNITLSDQQSRDRGFGPDCWDMIHP